MSFSTYTSVIDILTIRNLYENKDFTQKEHTNLFL